MKQADLGLNLTTKRTRKREFLDEMNRVVPWAALVELVTAHAPEGKKGRPPFPVETMRYGLQKFMGPAKPATAGVGNLYKVEQSPRRNSANSLISKRFSRLARDVLRSENATKRMDSVKKLLAFAALIGAAWIAPTAHAAVITTLFNTGVDASGNVVANATPGDLHYSLVTPGLTPTIQAATSAIGYPIASGPWLADNTTSRWIGPEGAQLSGVLNGKYIYQTTFNLTGFDHLTAVINGQFATDDAGGVIRLNGNPVGPASLGFSTWQAFSISTNFIAGLNTLQFEVINSGGGPTGLRVEMTGEARASAVPEPASLALVALGLIGAGLASRRRIV